MHISAATTSTASLTSGAGAKGLGKEAFLNLLTKQLQFQDPLKPMDSTEFVAQLAQFRELESSIEINKKLDILAHETVAMSNLAASNLLGRRVEVPGGRLTHLAGIAERISYQLNEDTSEVVMQVQDLFGGVVRSITSSGAFKKGPAEIKWDGRDNSGNAVGAGTYNYVISFKDKDGKLSAVPISSEGEVSGITYGEKGPTLTVNGASVPLGEVKRVLR
ncbi:MAG: flagellar hook capping FlgD N-terminal domain-containing protein [Nitrospirota bacterium]